jgi:hypothetical protein
MVMTGVGLHGLANRYLWASHTCASSKWTGIQRGCQGSRWAETL